MPFLVEGIRDLIKGRQASQQPYGHFERIFPVSVSIPLEALHLSEPHLEDDIGTP